MKQNKQLQQPFFARFLESQYLKQQTNGQGFDPFFPITAVLKDNPMETQKYPSDNDEDWPPIN